MSLLQLSDGGGHRGKGDICTGQRWVGGSGLGGRCGVSKGAEVSKGAKARSSMKTGAREIPQEDEKSIDNSE